MKKLLASLTAATTLAFAPNVLAQEADPTPAELATELVTGICAEVEAPMTCTAEQRAEAIARLTEIFSGPQPKDEYEQAAVMYNVFETLRQIFAPNEPMLPVPPRDRNDVEGYEICQLLNERMSIVCTMEQRDQLREMTIRFSQMPQPTTPEEQAARERAIFQELDRIFPEVARRKAAPAAAPARLQKV